MSDLPNVLLVTIDCLRADHMSCYGYERKTTPHIDRYTNKGFTIYRNHLSNGCSTPDSFPSIMCSRHRLEMLDNNLPKKWTTIAQMLKDYDYTTVGLVSANAFVSKFYGYHRGFDVFEDMTDGPMRGRDHWGKMKILVNDVCDVLLDIDKKYNRDLEFSELARKEIKKLTNQEDPWFMWTHYMDVHVPYSCSGMDFGKWRLYNVPYYDKILNKIVMKQEHLKLDLTRDVMDMYDSSICQVDRGVGYLLHELERSNKLKDTIVIITSDHGECFEERGTWQHPFYGVYEEQLRTPLIIRYPGNHPYQTVNDYEATCAADILPTIADVIGCYEPPIIRGRSILKLKDVEEERTIFHEGRVRKFLRHERNMPLIVRGATRGNYRLVLENRQLRDRQRLHDIKVDKRENKNMIKDPGYSNITKSLQESISRLTKDENRTLELEGIV